MTTAATLWLVTVIGPCFGGQLVLGAVTTVLGVITLWLLKWVDVVIQRRNRAALTITCEALWNVVKRMTELVVTWAPSFIQPEVESFAALACDRHLAAWDRRNSERFDMGALYDKP